MPLRPETRARARALQLLYARETDPRPALEEQAHRLGRLTRDAPEVLRLAGELAAGVLAARAALDQAVAGAAEHWRLERLALVDRNILRLAVFELSGRRVPPRVAIDEALWLAHRFGGRESPAFINGVLDRVARNLGLL